MNAFNFLIILNIILILALVGSMHAIPGRPLLHKIFNRRHSDSLLLGLSVLIATLNFAILGG